ncbi:hypothetical protein B0A52_08689 [Exophiala mesophila]|uniref:Crossover junction endonuclease MUS81 n=1 Tax=Exophiala mesophila TaxID=212818 RepID=A0A438MWQ6_EXOME|nr:hypothetical protein B0A52_08689 [Exophiala mesophila]
MPEECSNPLLAQWLKEWMDQAKERNSKGYIVYRKAYQSMIACPLVFNHPSEAQQLNGLGPKLCDRLTDKLKVYCDENGLPMPTKGKKRKQASGGGSEAQDEPEPESPPRKRKPPQYVPKMRSGAYALIKALGSLDQESNEALPKDRLIDLAQPFCDSNFKVPSDPTKFFTAWNSMKTLETKELVCTKGHPVKRYYLSDEGWEVALRIKAVEEGRPRSPQPSKKQVNKRGASALPEACLASPPKQKAAATSFLSETRPSPKKPLGSTSVIDLVSDSDSECPAPLLPNSQLRLSDEPAQRQGHSSKVDDNILLPAGSFEIKMVLDTREIRTTTDRNYISDSLRKLGVVPEMRSLPLGDVLWVAVPNPRIVETLKGSGLGGDEEGESEIMLEHIMERKRLDDLISSIKDGRFHEQKFRLRKSGIKHVTYLIEEYAISSEKGEKYGDALESAIATMQVVNGYFVKQTAKLDDTIQYLARMTRTLKSIYERQDIHVLPATRFEREPMATVMDHARKGSPGTLYGMTFSVFAALCDKSESMTLRDVFLRMLMCTRGVTGEKAVEIQKIWPTPRAFLDAYSATADGSRRDSMISDRLGHAIPRKKVAKTLSTKIAEVWS